MLDQWKLRDFEPVLSNFSTGWEAKELVGSRVAPLTNVSQMSGRYMVYDRSDWLIYPDRRAMGTVANEIQGGKWSTDTYSVREHALQVPVFDEEREQEGASGNFPIDFSLEQSAVETATRSILLGHELVVSTALRATASYASASYYTTLVGTAQWSDYTGTSDPIKDVETGLRQIYVGTGRTANTMVMPWIVWSYLRNHPKIVDRVKSFQLTTEGAFRELTGFEGTMIIAESSYNTADNIDASESISDFWGKDVWLGIVDVQPGQRTKTFIKTFVYPYQGSTTRPVDSWREEPRKADLFRVSMRYDIKVVSNTAGYLIKAAVA
jgi:hypothetical protein